MNQTLDKPTMAPTQTNTQPIIPDFLTGESRTNLDPLPPRSSLHQSMLEKLMKTVTNNDIAELSVSDAPLGSNVLSSVAQLPEMIVNPFASEKLSAELPSITISNQLPERLIPVSEKVTIAPPIQPSPQLESTPPVAILQKVDPNSEYARGAKNQIVSFFRRFTGDSFVIINPETPGGLHTVQNSLPINTAHTTQGS